jgi:dihydrofolate reductase
MGTAIMGCAAVSADGYIAYDDGQIGSLFDWMSGGDVGWKLSESDEHAMRGTQASKDFMQSVHWEYADIAPFTFVTDGVESAIRQALRLGLIDQIVMNVVPVVFGGGRPFFGTMEPGDNVTFGNPSRVAQGNRVTHLLYDVEH